MRPFVIRNKGWGKIHFKRADCGLCGRLADARGTTRGQIKPTHANYAILRVAATGVWRGETLDMGEYHMAKPTTDTKPSNPTETAILGMLSALNPAVTKAWLDLMQESARFMTTRLQHDVETQKALLACKSPSELMEVQTAFFKTAAAQYSDYTTRLYTNAEQTAASKPASRKYDDVPV